MRRCCFVLRRIGTSRVRAGIVAGVAAITSAVVLAQEKPGPSAPDAAADRSGKEVAFPNIKLKELILRAYRIAPAQLNGPSWLSYTRLDFHAHLPPGESQEKALQEFLTKEFKLEVSRQKRVMKVYVMEVAEGGPKVDETPAWDRRRDQCQRQWPRSQYGVVPGSLVCQGTSMAELAWNLVLWHSNDVGYLGPIVDRTGLTGVYDFTVQPPSAFTGSLNLGPVSGPPADEMRYQLKPLGLTIVEKDEAEEVLKVVHCEKKPAGKPFTWPRASD